MRERSLSSSHVFSFIPSQLRLACILFSGSPPPSPKKVRKKAYVESESASESEDELPRLHKGKSFISFHVDQISPT